MEEESVEYRQLGNSGLKVSLAGLGTNNFGRRCDAAQTAAVVNRAVDDLGHNGDVRYVGCSNFTAWQVVESQWVARSEHLSPFISAQNRCNLLDRRIEEELVPAAQKYGLGIIPYSPLGGGFLTGK